MFDLLVLFYICSAQTVYWRDGRILSISKTFDSISFSIIETIQFPRTLKQTVSQTKRGKNVVLWFLLGFIRKEDKQNNQILASNQRNAFIHN